MDKRYFLDANCLLNAAFIPTSWASEVTHLISKRGGTILTNYAVLDEAMKKAVSIALMHHLPLGVFPFLIRFMEFARIQVLPAPTPAAPVARSHDQHVKDGAIQADAILLTADIPLRANCESDSIKAMTLYEALLREKGLGLPTSFFGVTPSREKGTVFIRCSPCPDVQESFCVLEIEGFFKIHYDNTWGGWRLIVGSTPLDGPKISITGQASLAMAVDWDDREIRLRASGADHPVLLPHGSQFSPCPGRISIGHDLTGSLSWWRPIRTAVWNDQRLSRDSWVLCRDNYFATPNPFDHDRLTAAVCARLSRATR